jgi:hypothetical protein
MLPLGGPGNGLVDDVSRAHSGDLHHILRLLRPAAVPGFKPCVVRLGGSRWRGQYREARGGEGGMQEPGGEDR